jgi:hypothetical protein
MTRLNVRCCCNGELVLGTLEVPDGCQADDVIRLSMFIERPTFAETGDLVLT